MTTPRLYCKDVKKSFQIRGKTIEVLKGVELSVMPGEMVIIRGRSGQGKSVLLWLLSGIDMPTSGEVLFEGTSLSSLDNTALSNLRRQKIGLIFQNFNLIPSWTAKENVEAALLNSGLSSEERAAKAVALLEKFGLANRLDNLPAELSVGQQQRVAVARTLINEPSLLLADEPSGDVDPETASELLSVFKSFVKEKGASMVVASHGNFPLEAGDRVLRLQDGVLSPWE